MAVSCVQRGMYRPSRIGAIGHAACGIASRAYSSHCGHVGNQARRDETCTVSQLFHGPAPRSLIRRLAIEAHASPAPGPAGRGAGAVRENGRSVSRPTPHRLRHTEIVYDNDTELTDRLRRRVQIPTDDRRVRVGWSLGVDKVAPPRAQDRVPLAHALLRRACGRLGPPPPVSYSPVAGSYSPECDGGGCCRLAPELLNARTRRSYPRASPLTTAP